MSPYVDDVVIDGPFDAIPESFCPLLIGGVGSTGVTEDDGDIGAPER